jgi:flagellin
MALGINTNVGGLGSVNNAGKAQNVLGKALEKLSSGLAINRAADNPAGLIISEALRSQVGGISAAMRNAQEAFNVAAIAEGGMTETSDLLVRARELAVRAAGGTATDAQRAAYQTEMDNILASIDRIAETTRFAGEELLDGTTPTRTFQIAPDADPAAQATLDFPDVRTAQLGTAQGGPALDTLAAGGANDLAANPNAAIGIIDQAIAEVAGARGDIGAFQANTLQSAMDEMAVALENVTATESSIRDLDFAEGIVEQMRGRNLLQASLAALRNSNFQQQNILRLLG